MSDPRQTPAPPVVRPASSAPWAWLLVAAVPVFFLSLGANTIWDANEAFYVETPRQMILSGDYVTPRFNDADRLNKPVLSYWIVAALYRLFGIGVGVERLGIALGAAGIILAAFLVGWAVRSGRTGLLAAVVVATAPRVVMHSRRIFIDVYITLFMSLTLACFVLAERYPRVRRRWLWAMYACIGLGVLTKGPIAIVIPGLVAVAWATVERRWRDLLRLELLPGAAIVLAIVVPWYVALYARHGWAPVLGFFLGENVDRYLTSMVPGDARPVWFYLPVLLSDLFPWAPLVLVPLAAVWRRGPGRSGADGVLRRLLWWWIVCTVGLFSLSQTKQDLYIFPVTIAVAVLVADTLVRSDFGRDSRPVTWLLGTVALLTTVAAPAAVVLFLSGPYALDGVLSAAAVLAVGGLTALGCVVGRRGQAAALALALTFVAFNYLFVLRILPAFERFKPMPAFAATVADLGEPADRIGAYHFMQPSLVYYTDRPVIELATVDDVRAFVAGGPAWLVVAPDRYGEVAAAAPGLCVAQRHPVFGGRLDEVRAGIQREVWLVSNRCEGPASP